MAARKKAKRHHRRPKKTLLPVEVADYINMGIVNTRRMIREGEIESIRVGNRSYVPVVAIERWLRARRKKSNAA